MAKKKEVSVEEKLRALYDLQLIDSRIDEIRNVSHELHANALDADVGYTQLIEDLLLQKSEMSGYTYELLTDMETKYLLNHLLKKTNPVILKYELLLYFKMHKILILKNLNQFLQINILS